MKDTIYENSAGRYFAAHSNSLFRHNLYSIMLLKITIKGTVQSNLTLKTNVNYSK